MSKLHRNWLFIGLVVSLVLNGFLLASSPGQVSVVETNRNVPVFI